MKFPLANAFRKLATVAHSVRPSADISIAASPTITVPTAEVPAPEAVPVVYSETVRQWGAAASLIANRAVQFWSGPQILYRTPEFISNALIELIGARIELPHRTPAERELIGRILSTELTRRIRDNGGRYVSNFGRLANTDGSLSAIEAGIDGGLEISTPVQAFGNYIADQIASVPYEYLKLFTGHGVRSGLELIHDIRGKLKICTSTFFEEIGNQLNENPEITLHNSRATIKQAKMAAARSLGLDLNNKGQTGLPIVFNYG